MGWLALALATLAAILAVLPPPAVFVGMGAAVLAIAVGWLGYRRRAAPGSARLAGAGAITLGILALLITLARHAATLAAARELESFF